ncbi:unnamed protein product [Dibothriocephalus latus]|uniref:Uncharacterized protein n=1 Tax=Dibothriocephalus latus TaxID=60516 RepID=A0A3P7LJ75_DIBLA|nr:unnamed protein product [Dibothriocephalus latus]
MSEDVRTVNEENSDKNQPVLDISKEISKLRQRDLAITQLLQEAIEKANGRNAEGYGPPSHDQEAAADEAIERLCLRCHNLETRLAEKQAMLSSVTNEQETTSQIGTEVGNPSAGQEKADHQPSPQEKEQESAEDALSDMQSRYSALNALYEAALKR